MRSHILSPNIELCHHNGMVGSASQRSDPPLRCGQSRAMDSKGLVIGVPGGGGFQTTHVRTMAQLRLRVASENLVSCCAFEEKLVLFGSSLFPQGNLEERENTSLAAVAVRGRYTPYQEHGRMQTIRRGFANQVIGRINLLWRPIVLDGQLLHSLSLGQRTLDALDTAQ